MDRLWDRIREGLKDGFQMAIEKTEELSRLGRIKMEISSLHSEIRKLFTELGGEIYSVYKEKGKLTKTEKITEVLKKIEELEEKLKEKEEELKEFE